MKLIATFTVLALLGTYIQISQQNWLEDTSADFAEWVQSGRSRTVDIIFEIIGAVMGFIFVIISGIMFLMGKREEGMIGMSAALFGSALSGTLKMALMHPRPFWKYPKVLGIECPRDFGAPSGHALSTGCGLIVVGMIWLRSGGQFTRKIFILLFLFILTAFDRIYLGVHFYFQVTLGYLFAAMVSSIMLHPKFWKLVHKFGSDKATIKSVFSFVLAYTLVSLFLYIFGYRWDPAWSQIYQEKCNRTLQISDALIKNFSEALHVWLIFGCVIGYYFLKEKNGPPFSYQLLALSTVLHISACGFVTAMDSWMIKNMGGMSRLISLLALRLAGGFVCTFVLPLVITKIYGVEKTIKAGLPTRRGNTFDTKTKAVN